MHCHFFRWLKLGLVWVVYPNSRNRPQFKPWSPETKFHFCQIDRKMKSMWSPLLVDLNKIRPSLVDPQNKRRAPNNRVKVDHELKWKASQECSSYESSQNMTARATTFFDPNAPSVVLRSLFYKYDKDGSGQLSKEELVSLFQDDLGFTKEQSDAYS